MEREKKFQFTGIYLRENVFIILERAFWGAVLSFYLKKNIIYFPFVHLFLDVFMDNVSNQQYAQTCSLLLSLFSNLLLLLCTAYSENLYAGNLK